MPNFKNSLNLKIIVTVTAIICFVNSVGYAQDIGGGACLRPRLITSPADNDKGSSLERLRIMDEPGIAEVWNTMTGHYLSLYEFTLTLCRMTRERGEVYNFPIEDIKKLMGLLSGLKRDGVMLRYDLGFITLNIDMQRDIGKELFIFNLLILIAMKLSNIKADELFAEGNIRYLSWILFEADLSTDISRVYSRPSNINSRGNRSTLLAVFKSPKLILADKSKVKFLLNMESLLRNTFSAKRPELNRILRYWHKKGVQPRVMVLDEYRGFFEDEFFEQPKKYIGDQPVVERQDIIRDYDIIGRPVNNQWAGPVLPYEDKEKLRKFRLMNGQEVYAKRIDPLRVRYPEEEIEISERVHNVLQETDERFHAQKFIGIVYNNGAFFLLSLAVPYDYTVSDRRETEEVKSIEKVLKEQGVAEPEGPSRRKDILVEEKIDGANVFTVIDFETLPYNRENILEQDMNRRGRTAL